MPPPPASSTSRRYPCPCRPCRIATGPDCMQTRKTIKRHVEAQVEADFAGGLVLSDEQYAKIVSLLRGAGLPGDLYSGAYTHLMQVQRGIQDPPPQIGLLPASPNGDAGRNLAADDAGDDSGYFEAGDNLEVLADQHAVRLVEVNGDFGNNLDGSLDGSGPRAAPLDDQDNDDIFWDAPQGSDDYPHDLYRDDPVDSPRGSPAPQIIGGNPAHNVLGQAGLHAPLLLDDLGLDLPAGDGFSDWSSDHGPDGDELDPHVLMDVDAPPEEPEGPLAEDAFELDAHDPDYVQAEDLFDPAAPHEPPLPPGKLPSALEEDPLIRRAYVQAFISHAFHGSTHSAIEHMLKSEKSNLTSLSLRMGYDFPGLAQMAITLRTVERRLGVDPNQYITHFFLCTKCWKRHHSSDLYELPGSGCTEPNCDGLLYSTKILAGGKCPRRPLKPFPTSSLEHNVQRILMRPGKVNELNAWREGEYDEPGVKPPLNQDDWLGSDNPDFRMFDIYDGWGWNAIQAGLQRRRGGKWEIEDVDIHELFQRFVALPMGLVIMINIDWF
ncbi:hypothetical protein TRAPUB_11901 [Trametes pubescens]|uniref:Uncharacterized protein n=1 Tax=Trametes pubescens TaxID=154538 RepID=A0A1M2VVN2_TRAPU|nr:hypothetical protein TRAPUB_11901 [Trametes pubescens]